MACDKECGLVDIDSGPDAEADESGCITVMEEMCMDVSKEECGLVDEKICDPVAEEICDDELPFSQTGNQTKYVKITYAFPRKSVTFICQHATFVSLTNCEFQIKMAKQSSDLNHVKKR